MLAAQEYQGIDIRLIDIDLEQAIHLSNKFNVYAHDAYVLWCAVTFKAPLLCLDDPMVKFAKELGTKTIDVL